MLRCAVAFTDKYEYFALVATEINNKVYEIGRCEFGHSFGDLMAYPLEKWSEFISAVYHLRDTMKIDDIVHMMWSLLYRECRFVGADGKDEEAMTMNLLLLPLFAELINFGASFNDHNIGYKGSREHTRIERVFEQLCQFKQKYEELIKEEFPEDSDTAKCLSINDTPLELSGCFDRINTDQSQTNPNDLNWFFPDNANSLIDYVVLNYVQKGFLFRRCRYCHKLFALTDGYQSFYCLRPLQGNPLGCSHRSHGKARAYVKRMTEDTVKHEYKKAYCTYYARLQRGLITRSDYETWLNEAQRKRKECIEGKITLDEFKAWLTQDYLRKKTDPDFKAWEKRRKKCKHLQNFNQDTSYCGLPQMRMKGPDGNTLISYGPCEQGKCPLQHKEENP